jgi:ATP-dependent Zn protease
MNHQSISSALVTALLCSMVSKAAAGVITYDEFIRQVDAGNVTSVTIDSEGGISGDYRLGGKSLVPYETIGYTGSTANDPLLARLLTSKGITPSVAPSTTTVKEIGGLAMGISIPLLLLAWMIKIHWTLKSIDKRIPPGPGW